MADTLLTFAQMLAAVPDNTSSLISPANVRNSLLSASPDAGQVGDDTDWTLALTAGVPSNINALSPAPAPGALARWAIDGNAALIPAWSPITIPGGLVRGINVLFQCVIGIDTTAPTTLTFDALEGATIRGSLEITIDEGTQGSGDHVDVSQSGFASYEPGLALPWSIQVTSPDAVNLDFQDWALTATGVQL